MKTWFAPRSRCGASLALPVVLVLSVQLAAAEAACPAATRSPGNGSTSALPAPPEVEPILVPLPAGLAVQGAAELRLEVLRFGELVVSETLAIPEALPTRPVVELLADHGAERLRLRALAGSEPQALRLRVWVGDRMLHDLALDRLLTEPSAGAVAQDQRVGAPRRVEVGRSILPTPTAPVMSITAMAYEDGKDPACVQHCSDERDFCYEYRCDPRGSCEFCETEYDNCVISCPDECVDPKAVYNHYTYGPITSQVVGTECFENENPHDYIGDYYYLWESRSLQRTYERTEYCDGSYSDRFISEQYVFWYCYQLQIEDWCSSPFYYPYNQC